MRWRYPPEAPCNLGEASRANYQRCGHADKYLRISFRGHAFSLWRGEPVTKQVLLQSVVVYAIPFLPTWCDRSAAYCFDPYCHAPFGALQVAT